MRRNLLWLCLLLVLGISLPAFAADDSSDPTTKPDATDKKVYDKLIKSGKSFGGRLVKVDSDKRVLTVEVTYKSPKQDPQAVQHLANLQRQMVEAQLHRNPVERIKHLNHIQMEIGKATNNLYKDQAQKIELDAPDNMKVRTLVLPVEFDDKGKPRKLTDKEKRELKGPDPTLPGYTGDFDSLKADQKVEVHLAKMPPKSKDKDKDKDTDNTETTRPKIAMIVILAESTK
jgi:hypothetical protein